MQKIRVYKLAKELKIDNQKVIEEARRLGCNVSIPSNAIPFDIAEKIKSKFVIVRGSPSQN